MPLSESDVFECILTAGKSKSLITIHIWTRYVLLTESLCLQYGPGNQRQLKEACFVVNILDPKVKRELLTWFVKLQLSEYLMLFGENQDVSKVVLTLW